MDEESRHFEESIPSFATCKKVSGTTEMRHWANSCLGSFHWMLMVVINPSALVKGETNKEVQQIMPTGLQGLVRHFGNTGN